jgi:hypothetical protein
MASSKVKCDLDCPKLWWKTEELRGAAFLGARVLRFGCGDGMKAPFGSTFRTGAGRPTD